MSQKSKTFSSSCHPAVAGLFAAVLVSGVPGSAHALTCDEKITQLTATCMQGDLSKASPCRRQATEQANCGAGSSPSGPAPQTRAPESKVESKKTAPVAPPKPKVTLTEADVFKAYENACGSKMGSARVSGKILSCGTFTVEPARARENIWPMINEACRNVKANCNGNDRSLMLDLFDALQCPKLGYVCR